MSAQQPNHPISTNYATHLGRVLVAALVASLFEHAEKACAHARDFAKQKWKSKVFRFLLLVIVLVAAAKLGYTQQPSVDIMGMGIGDGQTNGVSGGGVEYGVREVKMDASQLVGMITSEIDGAVKRLSTNPALGSFGKYILNFGLFIGMLWASIKSLASGKGMGEMFAEWVPLFVAYGVVTAIVEVGGKEDIVRFMDMVAKAVAGGKDMSNIQGATSSMMLTIFDTIVKIIKMPMASGAGALDMWAWVTLLPSILWVVLAKALSAFLILAAGVAVLGTAILSIVSVKLVLALAPIMVSFLIFKPLAWLFDSWLKFLLGACMMKVVGAFMMTLVESMLKVMPTVAAMAQADAVNTTGLNAFAMDFLLYAFLIVISLLSAMLMAQVPGLSAGLISGGAGSAGFGGLKGVTNSQTGKMAGAAGGALGRGTAEAGRRMPMVGSNARAAKQGRSDAVNKTPMAAGRYEAASTHRAYVEAYSRNNKPAPPSGPPGGGGGRTPPS
jgi:hypothetical protein